MVGSCARLLQREPIKCFEVALSEEMGVPVTVYVFTNSNGRRKAWIYVGKEMEEVDAECHNITLFKRIAHRLERYIDTE